MSVGQKNLSCYRNNFVKTNSNFHSHWQTEKRRQNKINLQRNSKRIVNLPWRMFLPYLVDVTRVYNHSLSTTFERTCPSTSLTVSDKRVPAWLSPCLVINGTKVGTVAGPEIWCHEVRRLVTAAELTGRHFVGSEKIVVNSSRNTTAEINRYTGNFVTFNIDILKPHFC